MSTSVSVYIIGAQCTGKTTLLHALQATLSRKYPSVHLRPITEVARKVLQEHQFSRDDITDNPERALELQQLILAAQCNEESQGPPSGPVLCDRSGVDPIVYAVKYGPPQAQEILESSSHWPYLRDRMRKALVVLCPPQEEWLVDDGTRLMARNMAEWEDMHRTFVQVLEKNVIAFQTIPRGLQDLEERVNVVMHLWDSLACGAQSTCT